MKDYFFKICLFDVFCRYWEQKHETMFRDYWWNGTYWLWADLSTLILFRSVWYHGLNLGWKLLEGRVRVTFEISVQPLLSLSVGIRSFPMGRAAPVNVTPMKSLYHYLIYVYEVFYILNSKTGSIYISIGLLLDWCTPPGNNTGWSA